MYERMLDKLTMPTIEELARYCGENAELFSMLNEFMAKTFETEQKVVFPYGNKYPCGDGGWIHYRVTCEWLIQKVVWRPKVVEELTELASLYFEQN